MVPRPWIMDIVTVLTSRFANVGFAGLMARRIR
jgi:hypothetical protein